MDSNRCGGGIFFSNFNVGMQDGIIESAKVFIIIPQTDKLIFHTCESWQPLNSRLFLRGYSTKLLKLSYQPEFKASVCLSAYFLKMTWCFSYRIHSTLYVVKKQTNKQTNKQKLNNKNKHPNKHPNKQTKHDELTS